MRNEQFLNICGWMVNEMKLNGDDLLVYALVYQTTQDGVSRCFMQSKDIADFFGITPAKATITINRLMSSGLIESDGSSIKTTDISNPIPIQPNERVPRRSKDEMTKRKERFNEAWKQYQRHGSKKLSYEQWDKLSDNDITVLERHIPYFLRSRPEIQYRPAFERYIRNRVFENPVYSKENVLLFDPESSITSVGMGYAPASDGYNIHWNEKSAIWVTFSDPISAGVVDGYTDDERPEGAEVMYQGIVYCWDSKIHFWHQKN